MLTNLSFRNSGVRLLRDGAIASAIVALEFNIVVLSSARIDGRLIFDYQGFEFESRLRAAFCLAAAIDDLLAVFLADQSQSAKLKQTAAER